ncbi:MAG: formylglycine-generating enzyme family protein, partial [Fibromonadales bacterium]|nr:formylglycine-generating enzyme family protein [Fibromonadales bacterium]
MSTKSIFGTAMVAIAALFSSSMAQTGNTNYTVPLTGLSSNSKTLDMIFVEGGTFKRGCTEGDTKCESTEKPAHNVTLSSYYVGKYEITNAQWKAVMGEETSSQPSFPGSNSDNKPKASITWYDAIAFTCKLREMTGKKYRLLTDAEFEYAARGGKKTKGYLYSGSNNA